jgi:uncharacterized membrane protein required for colicin V production
MVASIDSTFSQVGADIVLLLLVGLNAYMGWRYGFLRRVVAFAGVYVACFAASNLGNTIAGIASSHSVTGNAWAFIFTFVIVVFVCEVLAAMVNERLQKLAVVLFDRVAGLISGVVVGLSEALILFLVAFAVAQAPATRAPAGPGGEPLAHALDSATLTGQATRLEPFVSSLFSVALPHDLSSHLQEGTPAPQV